MEAGPGSREIRGNLVAVHALGAARDAGVALLDPGSWTELGWRLVITIHFDPGSFGAVGLYLKIE